MSIVHIKHSKQSVFKPLFSALLLLLFTFLTLSPDISNAEKLLEKVSIQLPWKYQFEFAGYIAAKEMGFYRDVGLDVELKELADNQQDLIKDVLEKRSDYAVYDDDLIQVLIDSQQPQPVVLLANYFKRSPLVLISHKSPFLPDQLAHNKIMVTRSQINKGVIRLLLKKFHIDPQTLSIVPHSFNIDDFIDAKVDVTTAYLSNEIYQLQKQNIPYSLIDPNSYGIYASSNNLFTTRDTVTKYYTRTQRLIEASNKGWQYALAHPQKIAQIIYQHYSKRKSIEALNDEARIIKSLMLAKTYPIGSYDKQQIRKNIEILNNDNLMNKDYSLSGLFFDDYKPQQLNFTDAEKQFIKLHPVIIVANELDWFPYDFTHNSKKTGQPMGYAIDYMKLLAHKVGVQINFHSDYWHNLLKQAKSQKIDVLHAVTKNNERESYLSFTKPFFNINYTLASLRSSENPITSLEQLDGKILALGKNWSITNYIHNQYPNINILEVNNSRLLIEAVIYGRADASIDDFQTASYLAHKLFISNLVFTPLNNSTNIDIHLRIAFRKELQPMVAIFEKAMDSITINELNQLKRKWFKHARKFKPFKASNIYFSPQELAYLEKKKALSVCIDPQWMPLEGFENGQYIGMTADYFKLFRKVIPIPINVLKTASWTESIEQAKSRNCDLFSLAMSTEERQTYMSFTKPYLTIPLVIATKNDIPFIPDISLITDKKIGIVKDYAFAEILRERYPRMKIININSLTEGLNLVNNGKIFGVVDTLATIGYQIQNHFIGELKIAGKFNENWELGVATRNDEPLLNLIFNKAISSISQEEQQKILNQWVSVKFEKAYDYNQLIKWSSIIFGFILLILYRDYTLNKYNKQLEKLATTDKLTQLFNRQKIDQALEYQKNTSDRYGQNFCIIIIDIDYFKNVNDSYGHLSGDSVLIEFASLLTQSTRSSDIVGRWGGEEFLIICPSSTQESTYILAEKIRRRISKYHFKQIKDNLTASFGIAEYRQPNQSIQTLVHLADQALYQAKNNGRNQTVCSDKPS